VPQEGDFRYLDRDDKGVPRPYVLNDGDIVDVGTLQADRFRKKDLPAQATTAIEGTITDLAGKPVENVMVLAFSASRKDKRPLFISDRSKKDGTYVLRIAEGAYYLRARDVYGGGQPRLGGFMGNYGEKEPVAVPVKNGEIVKGIDIKVFAVQVRAPQSESAPKFKKDIVTGQ
jgi:hypothetical protein